MNIMVQITIKVTIMGLTKVYIVLVAVRTIPVVRCSPLNICTFEIPPFIAMVTLNHFIHRVWSLAVAVGRDG